VVEIAASSAAIDLRDKKDAYCRNGVREYLVWQVFDQKLDWFYRQDDQYVSLLPNEEEVICSQTFPGLWLSVPALLAGDMQQVLSVLQIGLSSPAHVTFVQQLTQPG
jgi:Uma2 family endonuclease